MVPDPLKGAMPGLDKEVLFRLDTKGDRQNLAYQSLHSASLPKYHLRSNAIGLDRSFRLWNTSATRRQTVASGQDSALKPNHRISWSIKQDEAQLVRGGGLDQDDIIRQQVNFVAVEDGRSRKRRRLSYKSGSDEESDDGDPDHSSDVLPERQNEDRQGFQTKVQQRQRELTEQVSKQSDDIGSWIALIHLQADIVRASEGQHALLSKSQQRTAANLRISLYQDALSKSTNVRARERLIQGLMKEGTTMWDKSRQSAEWKKFLKNTPSFGVYLNYLGFVQTSHEAFSYEHTVSAFCEGLKLQMLKPLTPDRDRNCIHMLLRLTAFMEQAGYLERSVAVWQAMLELNLCRPPSITAEEALDALEAFWESECARFGEPGATGWNSNSEQIPVTKTDVLAPGLDPQNLYDSWARAESDTAIHSALPARTLDNTNPDDPFRVVLFSDIRDFLVQLSSDDSSSMLFDSLLCYFGLPSVSQTSRTYSWRTDPFLHQTNHNSLDTEAEEQCNLRMPFSGVSDLTTLFVPTGPFAARSDPTTRDQLRSWGTKCVEQAAVRNPNDEELAIFSLALVLRNDPPSARKLAKRLIKQTPNSLSLYNAFALVEFATGKEDAAENVWRMTISMQSSSKDADMNDTLHLWRTWIFEYLNKGNMAKISSLLQSIPTTPSNAGPSNTPKQSPPESLTQKEHWLQSHLAQALSSQSEDTIILSTDLLAILRYCRTNKLVTLVLETYQTTLNILAHDASLQGNNILLETIHQRRAQFIHTHTHALKAAFSPKPILSALAESLNVFPHNSIFITLHDWYQRRYARTDRLRSIASAALSHQHPPSFLTVLQTIRAEISRFADAGGTQHSIRAAFTRAVAQDNDENDLPAPGDVPVSERNWPVLHLSYLQWEINHLDQQHQQRQNQNQNLHHPSSHPPNPSKLNSNPKTPALNALFSAIRACPWMKEIYLSAFGSEAVRQMLGQEGLKGLYESMVERGLRVYVDIGDLI